MKSCGPRPAPRAGVVETWAALPLALPGAYHPPLSWAGFARHLWLFPAGIRVLGTCSLLGPQCPPQRTHCPYQLWLRLQTFLEVWWSLSDPCACQ